MVKTRRYSPWPSLEHRENTTRRRDSRDDFPVDSYAHTPCIGTRKQKKKPRARGRNHII